MATVQLSSLPRHRVKLVETSPKSGRLEIHYSSLDELDAVLAKILR